MINRTNIVNSGARVFRILQKLFVEDCTKKELLNGFSEDSLAIYLNTLKKLGIKITFPNRGCPYYSLREGMNFINFNDEDIKLLSEIKGLLALKASYQDIVNFNILLLKLAKYTNQYYAEKMLAVINQKPFGIELHDTIFDLQNCIREKHPLLITYNSPNSSINYFKVLPKFLKLENGKIYLWCDDNSLKESRYLRLDRIINFKILDEFYETILVNNYAICEFINFNGLFFEPEINCKILF